MFGTSMTIIIIGYIGYYGYNIVYDLYFNKSGEVVTTAAVDEQEVDIKDELGDFTQFNADEDIINKYNDFENSSRNNNKGV